MRSGTSLRGEHEQAERLYQQLLRSDVSSLDTSRAMFGVAMARDDTLKALEIGREMLRLDPQNPQYLRSVGSLYLQLGERDQAIEAYRKLVALLPGPSTRDERAILGVLLRRTGQLEEAITQLEVADSLRKLEREPLTARGESLMERRRFPEAHRCFQRLSATFPDNLEYRLALIGTQHAGAITLEDIGAAGASRSVSESRPQR